MRDHYPMSIGGESVTTDETLALRNPADTDEIVGRAPIATPAHLDDAVDAARRAFADWRRAPDSERAAACETVARVAAENAEELSVLLTREQGKPLAGMGSRFELGGAQAWAGHTATLELPDKIIQNDENGRVLQQRVPLGVVASITPWNWPLMIAVWHIVPALRTGNTVVIKPSPYTPLTTLRFVELLNEALPPGVINCVSGGDELGAALTGHEGVDKIVFTGSIATGRKVMSSAAAGVVPVTLELGGNDAGILLPGADPKQFVEGLFFGAMINSGQTCGALKRLYVQEGEYEAACEVLAEFAATVKMGDGMDEASVLGPLQNQRQFERVIELVEDAKARGGRVLCGGAPTGGNNYFYPVTFVADISDGVRLVDEEQFGPVLPIVRYSTVEDAIARANGTEYGLGASVWGPDREQAAEVAAELEAGTVWINRHAAIQPNAPMGGVKCSGIGVEFGEEGLAAYTAIKITNAAA